MTYFIITALFDAIDHMSLNNWFPSHQIWFCGITISANFPLLWKSFDLKKGYIFHVFCLKFNKFKNLHFFDWNKNVNNGKIWKIVQRQTVLNDLRAFWKKKQLKILPLCASPVMHWSLKLHNLKHMPFVYFWAKSVMFWQQEFFFSKKILKWSNSCHKN